MFPQREGGGRGKCGIPSSETLGKRAVLLEEGGTRERICKRDFCRGEKGGGD